MKKKERIEIRCTSEEKAHLQESADLHDMTLTEYILWKLELRGDARDIR